MRRTRSMSLLLGLAIGGCERERPPQPPPAAVAPGAVTTSTEPLAAPGAAFTQESCELVGGDTDASGKPVVYPFSSVRVRATFRIGNRAAAEALRPIIYFVKFSEKRGNDVIYQGEHLKKVFDGDVMTLETELPAPSKAGEFRVEIFDGRGGRPGSIFGRSTLMVEQGVAKSRLENPVEPGRP